MRMPMCGPFVAAFLSLLHLAPAQVAPPPTLLATEQYLFVLRGESLHQFDLHTLVLRNSFTFPATVPGAATLPLPGGVETVVSSSEPAAIASEPQPQPEPPPSPSPPAAADWKGGVDRALHWLRTHQDDDGKWDCDGFMKHDRDGEPCSGPGNAVHDVGVTGLALLAFLGSGSTMRSGPYQDNIKKGVFWLKEQQQENGLFGTNASHDFIYDHAIATYAMSEAFGLSSYQLLKPTVQKGLDYLESHRNPFAVWRYQPRDGDNDTSVTTWAVLAFESGEFFGLQVNKEAQRIALIWYDQVTGPDGRAGYTKQGERSSRMPGDHALRHPVERGEAMTAAAMYGRMMLGQVPKTTPVLKSGADVLMARLPRWSPGSVDAVYWYFGTSAMYQFGGQRWDVWRDALKAALANQCTEGPAAGSWEPIGVWDEVGGRVFVTALHAMTLQTVGRYTRMR
jgi:hypothetical protein